MLPLLLVAILINTKTLIAEQRMSLYPFPQRMIHDYANKLDYQLENSLEQAILKTRHATTAELVVVIVPSLQAMPIEDYANQLFNSWGIGSGSTNNGILLLFALQDKSARIEVGVGLEQLISDQLAGKLLDTEILPFLTEQNIETGVKRGTLAILDILNRFPDLARGTKEMSTGHVIRSPYDVATNWCIAIMVISELLHISCFFISKYKYYPTIAFVMVVPTLMMLMAMALVTSLPYLNVNGYLRIMGLFAFIGGISSLRGHCRYFSRYKKHLCRKCATRQVLLCEIEEDALLSEQEQLEENLGSVDYDLWVCPACYTHEKKEYINWMSHFAKCPVCNHRTLAERKRVLNLPSQITSGVIEIENTCQSCWHTTTRMKGISAPNQMSHFAICPVCHQRTLAERKKVLNLPNQITSGVMEIENTCQSCWHTTTRMETISASEPEEDLIASFSLPRGHSEPEYVGKYDNIVLSVIRLILIMIGLGALGSKLGGGHSGGGGASGKW
jgi:uncharacterized protein